MRKGQVLIQLRKFDASALCIEHDHVCVSALSFSKLVYMARVYHGSCVNHRCVAQARRVVSLTSLAAPKSEP
jgi:hypothetical protein